MLYTCLCMLPFLHFSFLHSTHVFVCTFYHTACFSLVLRKSKNPNIQKPKLAWRISQESLGFWLFRLLDCWTSGVLHLLPSNRKCNKQKKKKKNAHTHTHKHEKTYTSNAKTASFSMSCLISRLVHWGGGGGCEQTDVCAPIAICSYSSNSHARYMDMLMHMYIVHAYLYDS